MFGENAKGDTREALTARLSTLILLESVLARIKLDWLNQSSFEQLCNVDGFKPSKLLFYKPALLPGSAFFPISLRANFCQRLVTGQRSEVREQRAERHPPSHKATARQGERKSLYTASPNAFATAPSIGQP